MRVFGEEFARAMFISELVYNLSGARSSTGRRLLQKPPLARREAGSFSPRPTRGFGPPA
jgi:hypothetical protein